jgi:hypothetical protein
VNKSYPFLPGARNNPLFFLSPFPVLLAALIVAFAAGAANAASIRVGVDGEGSLDPAAIKHLDPGESTTLRIYLNLEGEEVASIFEAHFDLSMSGSWGVTLDLSEVNPGIAPFGVGTWPNAVGNLTATRASVSLTSNNTGGERLVARLDITRNSDTPEDIFEVSLAPGMLVYMDIPAPPWAEPVEPVTCAGTTCDGAQLFAAREPTAVPSISLAGFALLAGLVLGTAGWLIRRRSIASA